MQPPPQGKRQAPSPQPRLPSALISACLEAKAGGVSGCAGGG
ncbi:MAG TPA: hypothetical protein VFA10_21090 [Ktedonobacteraceae bacterium]|nr:hypothetical protein [Ktedonobacteraceae bacterium]